MKCFSIPITLSLCILSLWSDLGASPLRLHELGPRINTITCKAPLPLSQAWRTYSKKRSPKPDLLKAPQEATPQEATPQEETPQVLKIGNPCFDDLFRYAFSRPTIARGFLNSVFDFKDEQVISKVNYLPFKLLYGKESSLPKNEAALSLDEIMRKKPRGAQPYSSTVDLLCQSQDGRQFLVAMQNECNALYTGKAYREHCRRVAQIDVKQHSPQQNKLEVLNRKFWKDFQGVHTLVITNRHFTQGKKITIPNFRHYINKNKTFILPDERNEPFLFNAYSYQHDAQYGRHYPDINSKICILALGNLNMNRDPQTPRERWAYLLRDERLNSGSGYVPFDKLLKNPDKITGTDPAMKEFIKLLDIKNLKGEEVEEVQKRTEEFNLSQELNLQVIKEEERFEEKRQIARRLLSKGFDDADIAETTELSLEEIAALKGEGSGPDKSR